MKSSVLRRVLLLGRIRAGFAIRCPVPTLFSHASAPLLDQLIELLTLLLRQSSANLSPGRVHHCIHAGPELTPDALCTLITAREDLLNLLALLGRRADLVEHAGFEEDRAARSRPAIRL